jgi:O-antigen ligase
MLLCIYYLFGKKKSVVGIVFAACCIPLGFVTLLAANSRGPIVCMVISLSLFWFAGLRGKARIVVLALGFLFGVAFPTVTAMLQDKGESDDIMSRFDKLNDQGSLEQESRYFTYAAAWAGYIENPVFGYRLELPSADVNDGDAAYPHNIVLESLMTTGTLGGILLIALLTAATRAAWRLLRGQHPNNWIALLFVQYLFAAMFSGGIYNDAELWQYSLAVFALDKVFSSQSVQTHE